MTETIYDQYGRAFVLPGLRSDFAPFFKLQQLDTTTGTLIDQLLIQEPGKWSDLKLTLERDGDWHGVQYEYTDSKTVLEYDGYSGRDYIQTIFLAKGEDATILLQYGLQTNADTFIISYQGRLNLSTYRRAQRRIQCSLERSSMQSLIRAKWETKLNLFNYISLDNRVIHPQIPVAVSLLPQALNEAFLCDVAAGKRTDQTFSGDAGGHIWIQFDTSNPQTSEIEELATGKIMGVTDSDGPVANDEYLFKFTSGGVRRIEMNLSYKLFCAIKKKTIQIGKSYMTGFTIETSVVLKRTDGTLLTYPVTVTMKVGAPAGNKKFRVTETSNVVAGTLDVTLNILPGDKLFLFGKFAFTYDAKSLSQTQAEITLINQHIKITGKSTNSASQTLGLTVSQAIDAGITLITNKTDRLRSKFYGLKSDRYATDGCGALRLITNGYQIRQFKPDDHPLTLSLREIMLSLQSIDAVGMTFTSEIQPDGTPVEVMEVRPAIEYYSDIELLRIDSVSEYTEEVIADQLFSTLEYGYTKSVDEGAGALEECFTQQQATTPLKYETAKASYISTLIASSLAIERTRREQFATTPKDGTTFDDEGFLIQCKRVGSYNGPATFITGFASNTVQVPKALPWLAVGSQIIISGSPKNSQTYTVSFVSDVSKSPWTFYVNKNVAFENLTAVTIALTASVALIPEIGADLPAVSGLLNGDTTYNLRLTPGRMLLNNAPLWAGCLADQPDTAHILKTHLPQNAKVGTRIGPDACSDGSLVQESRTLIADEVRGKARLRPRRIRFVTRLSESQLQRLRLAHTGLLPPEPDEKGQPVDKNYGKITVPDEAGNYVSGWLDSLEWSPTSESVTLTLRRSALDLNSSADCSDFIGWTLKQVEQADAATRRRIELCTWRDVDTL